MGISILFMPISFTVALEYAISHDNLIITKLQNTWARPRVINIYRYGARNWSFNFHNEFLFCKNQSSKILENI